LGILFILNDYFVFMHYFITTSNLLVD